MCIRDRLAFTGWHDVDLGFLLPKLITDLEQRKNALIGLRDRADEVVGRKGSGDDRAAELVREVIASVEGHLEVLRQEKKRQKNKPAVVAP